MLLEPFLTFHNDGEVPVEVVVLRECALVHAGLVEGDVEDERLSVGFKAESLVIVFADHDAVSLPRWSGLGAKIVLLLRKRTRFQKANVGMVNEL